MRVMLILLMSAAFGVSVAIAGATDACMDCHFAEDFAGEDSNALVEKLKAVRDGAVRHPPALQDVSDEDLAAVAAELNGSG